MNFWIYVWFVAVLIELIPFLHYSLYITCMLLLRLIQYFNILFVYYFDKQQAQKDPNFKRKRKQRPSTFCNACVRKSEEKSNHNL